MEPSGYGGTPRHVFDLLHGIDTEVFDVWLGYSSGRADADLNWRLERARVRGIRTIQVPMSRSISPAKDLAAFLTLYRLFKMYAFDVVHCHSSKAGFLGRVAARLSRKNVVTIFTPHGMAYNIHKYYWPLEKIASWFTDIIVATSESEKNEIVQYRIVKASKIKVVYNGLSAEIGAPCLSKAEVSERRKALGISESQTIVGSGGRLFGLKDPLTFFQAAVQVQERCPNTFFVWIGDGEEKLRVQNFIGNSPLSGKAAITGWVPAKTTLETIELLDIFVSTSTSESFGYMTCEAMAKSKPIVATRITGTVDLVRDGLNGILVSKKAPLELADAIARLVACPADRTRMGSESSKRFLAQFTVTRMIKDIETLYIDALAQKERRNKVLPMAATANS
jgi:glycosyltransferase involved in cell wall biosynthesis